MQPVSAARSVLARMFVGLRTHLQGCTDIPKQFGVVTSGESQ